MDALGTDFTAAAGETALQSLAERLRERNFEVIVVDTGREARDIVMSRIPDGAEVHTAKSKTLEDIGVFQELSDSGRFDFVRKRLFALDRATQAREFRKLPAAPDYMVGSVQAITEAGQMVVASASGSQIGPYAAGAGTLLIVAGSQKLVPDLDTAMRRITEHVEPYEDERLLAQMGVHTKLCRVLILERDYNPGRTTVVLVREPVGV